MRSALYCSIESEIPYKRYSKPQLHPWEESHLLPRLHLSAIVVILSNTNKSLALEIADGNTARAIRFQLPKISPSLLPSYLSSNCDHAQR